MQEPIRGPGNTMSHVFKAILMFTVQKSSLNFPHRLVLAAVFLTVTACAGSVAASSPAASSAHDWKIAQSCTKASGLKNARAVGRPMVYDDRTGLTALLVSGRYPQPHMKNRPGRVLCLFDRKNREAFVTDADQLSIIATRASTASNRKK